MPTKFGKAAEAEWDAALMAYAARHKLSKTAATLEFANTAEANEIYKRTKQTPRVENIAKAAAVGNGTIEFMAKEKFPDDPLPTAVVKFLETPDGAEAYNEAVRAKTRAEQGFT